MSNAILILETQHKTITLNKVLVLVLVSAVVANAACLWAYL